MFIVAQTFGLVGLIFLILSFKENNKKFLLKHQTLSNLMNAFQYILLKAYSGCYVSIICAIRNFIFTNTKKQSSMKYLIIIIILTVIPTILSYNEPISLLPCIGTIIFTISLIQSNLTIIRIAESIACLLYIIYNIKVLAITGLIYNIIELIATLSAIYKHDRTKLK